MKPIVAYVRSEPALVAAVVLAVVQLLALSDDWQKLIFSFLSLVAGTVVRGQVSPVAAARGD